MPQLQLHDARDPDASLYYQVYGHGPEKVIFIMGYMGTHRLWGAQAAFFAKRPEVSNPSLPQSLIMLILTILHGDATVVPSRHL